MPKDYAKITTGSKLLCTLLILGEAVLDSYSAGSLRRAVYPEAHEYYRNRNFDQLLKRLCEKGYIKTEYKEAKRIVKLTRKGEIEALFKQSLLTTFDKKHWNGKWTIFSFDVPEQARTIRARIRRLLKAYGFHPLQDSVYISPAPFPAQGFAQLERAKLVSYISVFTAESITNDKTFRKQFGLS